MREKEVLIACLAVTDGIFRPQRSADWIPPAPGNIQTARQRFPVAGVALPGGGTGAERVARHTLLNDLAAARLIELYGGGRCRLTELGDHYARALCGLPNLAGSHAMLRKVIALSATADGLRLTSELWLCGLRDYAETTTCKTALWELSGTLAPVASRGLVTSGSDGNGRAYYTATPEGVAWAAAPAPTTPGGPAYDDSANALYHSETRAARERLRTLKPSCPGEIGAIPLSSSLDLRRPKVPSAANLEVSKIQKDANSEARRMRRLAAVCDKRGNKRAAAAARAAADAGEELARRAAAPMGGAR